MRKETRPKNRTGVAVSKRLIDVLPKLHERIVPMDDAAVSYVLLPAQVA